MSSDRLCSVSSARSGPEVKPAIRAVRDRVEKVKGSGRLEVYFDLVNHVQDGGHLIVVGGVVAIRKFGLFGQVEKGSQFDLGNLVILFREFDDRKYRSGGFGDRRF